MSKAYVRLEFDQAGSMNGILQDGHGNFVTIRPQASSEFELNASVVYSPEELTSIANLVGLAAVLNDRHRLALIAHRANFEAVRRIVQAAAESCGVDDLGISASVEYGD